ncbi:MAG: prefoldin subunit alpha [Candidatus Methanofastidiosia archaeon]|jgi:prefoldin alpha subunit
MAEEKENETNTKKQEKPRRTPGGQKDPSEMSQQELVVTIQILQEQAQLLASNLEQLSNYLQDLSISKATLEGVKALKKGDEILVPIGGSTFVKARIEDVENVIVGAGADVSMGKKIAEGISTMTERITMTQSRIQDTQETYQKVAQKLQEYRAYAQRVIKGE